MSCKKSTCVNGLASVYYLHRLLFEIKCDERTVCRWLIIIVGNACCFPTSLSFTFVQFLLPALVKQNEKKSPFSSSVNAGKQTSWTLGWQLISVAYICSVNFACCLGYVKWISVRSEWCSWFLSLRTVHSFCVNLL